MSDPAFTTLGYQGLLKTRAHGILSLLHPISPVVIEKTTFSHYRSPFPDPRSSLPKAILKTSEVGLCTYFFSPPKHLQPSRTTKTQGIESITDKTRPKTSDHE